MEYAKPEVWFLESAVSAIQSQGKPGGNLETPTDYTSSAYEIDE